MAKLRTKCESCGLPVEVGHYCQHCVDADGNLQTFDERLDRLSGWLRNRREGLSQAEAEAAALEQMSKMPAWRAHPALRRRLAD